MRKSELTEEEKDIYIRLFYPLSKQQKNNVYKIWKDNINEDIYIKYKKLENYCDKNDCDLMMALFQIYDSYNYFYFSFDSKLGIDDYINNKSLSDSLRGINSLCLNNEFNKKIMNVKDDTLMHHFELLKKKPIDKESDINLHVAMEKYLKKQPQEQKINEYRVYHVFEERKKIEDYILELISERRENPEKYINDNIKTKVRINKKSLFNNPYNDLEKQMYIPYDKTYSNKRNYANLNNDETIKENQETITQSNTSLQSDLCVGCYDAKRTRELYDECCNVVFKYCNLEDFVNSLNNPEECNLIVKYQSRLYVLYKFFDDIFGEEGEEKIEKLNEKFNISQSTCSRKNSSYEKLNTTLKKFYNILVGI